MSTKQTKDTKRPKWPPIKRATKNGRGGFLVDARVAGRGQRRFFATKKEADGFAEIERAKRANEGTAAVHSDELTKYGWTVQRAIAFALEHLRKASAAQPLETAAEKFLAEKGGLGLSARYVRDLRAVLDAFRASNPGATTASVEAEEIKRFLTGLHPVTSNNRRRLLGVFFKWCVRNDLVEKNPVYKVPTSKEPETTPGVIVSRDLAAMLRAAQPCIIPFIVFGAFCGMRRAEIARLDWSNVDLGENVVALGAGITKTNSRRSVKIPRNAALWLAPLAKDRGAVFESGPETRAAWDLCRMAAGFGPFETRLMKVREAAKALTGEERGALRPWPENALRHKAISARIALSAEAAAEAFGVKVEAAHGVTGVKTVAFEAGNSPQTIQAHYLDLTKPSEAAAWFAIKP